MKNKLQVFLNQYSDIFILALSGGLLFFGWQAAENYFTPFYKLSNQTAIALKALSLLYGSVIFGNILAPLISSKIGLKNSLSLGFLSYPLFIFSILSKNTVFLYPAAILLGLGAGIKSNSEVAYIGLVSPKEKRGSFSGFYWAVVRIGASLGLIFALIYLYQNNFAEFYLILGSLAFIATILIFKNLKEPNNFQKSQEPDYLKKKLGEIFRFIFNEKVLLLAPAGIASGFIFGLITGKIPLTIQTLYGVKWIAILSIIFQVTRAILTHPMGIISDKIGRFNIKYLSILLAIGGASCFLLSKNLLVLIITLFIFGVVYAIEHSNGPALSLDLFENKIQTASAASSIISTFAGTIPSFLLSTIKSDNYLITVAIGLCLIGLIFAKILEIRLKKRGF
jgi:MFS family permease